MLENKEQRFAEKAASLSETSRHRVVHSVSVASCCRCFFHVGRIVRLPVSASLRLKRTVVYPRDVSRLDLWELPERCHNELRTLWLGNNRGHPRWVPLGPRTKVKGATSIPDWVCVRNAICCFTFWGLTAS